MHDGPAKPTNRDILRAWQNFAFAPRTSDRNIPGEHFDPRHLVDRQVIRPPAHHERLPAPGKPLEPSDHPPTADAHRSAGLYNQMDLNRSTPTADGEQSRLPGIGGRPGRLPQDRRPARDKIDDRAGSERRRNPGGGDGVEEHVHGESRWQRLTPIALSRP